MHAHAVVFTGPRRVAHQAITCPEPGPDDVVVDVHHSWISNGTEGSFLCGERLSGDEAWRPGDPAPFPMVAGYQKVGHVSPAVCRRDAILKLPAGVDPLACSGLVLTQVGYNCGSRP